MSSLTSASVLWTASTFQGRISKAFEGDSKVVWFEGKKIERRGWAQRPKSRIESSIAN